MKIYILCKPNTILDSASSSCFCPPTFYLSVSDPDNCKTCSELCEEVDGVYRCKSCKSNAVFDAVSETCSCSLTFHLSASGPESCSPCTGLCEECEEVNGVYS